jgi:hypothetical protein
MAGWEDLYNTLKANNLDALADTFKEAIKANGTKNYQTALTQLRQSTAYKQRFAGNEELRKQGKVALTEGEYISTEKAYDEVLASYGAKDFSTMENKSKWISGNVSGYELSQRFGVAYNKVTAAVSNDDKALLSELRNMYPGVTDMELTKTLLLGQEGSAYLKNKLDIADIKAAQTEAGLPSALGAGYLASQGVSREVARAGLSKVAAQTGGLSTLASIYQQDTAPDELQKELESENVLGMQAGAKTKKLASQARASFKGQSGITTGSLKRTRPGSI